MGFWKDEKKVYAEVREGTIGLETFINPNISGLTEPHKKQLVEFFNECIKLLRGK